MVRILILLIAFNLTSIFFSSHTSIFAAEVTKAGGKADWVLVNDESGIKVFERWVDEGKNTKVKERSGKMTLNCSIDDIINVISDVSKTHVWMSYVEKSNVLKRSNENEWFVYTLLNAPWPFGRQDMVSKYQVIRDDSKHSARILITRDMNLYPKQKGIDRLDTFNAYWELSAGENNTVNVTFTTKSTEPPKYPAWIQDPVVRKVFLSNLEHLKDYLAKA